MAFLDYLFPPSSQKDVFHGIEVETRLFRDRVEYVFGITLCKPLYGSDEEVILLPDRIGAYVSHVGITDITIVSSRLEASRSIEPYSELVSYIQRTSADFHFKEEANLENERFSGKGKVLLWKNVVGIGRSYNLSSHVASRQNWKDVVKKELEAIKHVISGTAPAARFINFAEIMEAKSTMSWHEKIFNIREGVAHIGLKFLEPTFKLSPFKEDSVPLTHIEGGICGLDIFDSQTNFNLLCSSAAGAGGSFFIVKLILDQLNRGSNIVLYDVGLGYRKLVNTLGGDFNEVTTQTSVNPFWGYSKAESFDILKLVGVFEAIAPEIQGKQELKNIIGAAIMQVYKEKGTKVSFVDIFYVIQDDLSLPLLRKLRPFADGEYKSLLNGSPTFDADSLLSVYEFEHLSAFPIVKSVACVSLMFINFRAHRLRIGGGKLNQTCHFVLEAWDLIGQSPAHVFQGFAQEAKKYNSSLITVIHSFDEINTYPSIKAIQEMSAWEVFCGAKLESIYQYTDDQELRDLISQARPRRNKFNRIAIKSPGHVYGLFDLHFEIENLLAYTTNPKFDALLKDSGYSLSGCDVDTFKKAVEVIKQSDLI